MRTIARPSRAVCDAPYAARSTRANTGLHPGIALRIFEEGREINPEAARRAAEAALESPNLHESKRERLTSWLSGRKIEVRPEPAPPEPAPASPTPPATGPRVAASPTPRGPRIEIGTLERLEDDALVMGAAPHERLAYDEIQAVSVAEIMGLEEEGVRVIDLIRNWAARKEERLDIVRLRVDQLDLGKLVTRKHALVSDFAALMGDIMERTHAIPLPDPDSALGNRISCFGTPELYERLALRAQAAA